MLSRTWLLAALVLGAVVVGSEALELGLRRAALMARARQEAADRLRRGFQNSALATARGFGKRGGDAPLRRPGDSLEVTELYPGDNNGAQDFGFGARDGGHWKNFEVAGTAASRTAEAKRSNAAIASDTAQRERYPVSMVGDLVSSSPSLATSLVSRFLDTDADGFVSASELVNVLQ